MNDVAILALAEKISVVDDGSADPAAFTPLIASARTKDGRVVNLTINVMLGAPINPLTEAQHMEKARCCLAYAGLESVHAALCDAISSLELARDAAAALDISAPELRMDAVD